MNREYVVTDNIYTTEEVKKVFSEKLSKIIGSLEEKGVQIIKKNVTINKKNKKWQMQVQLQIVEKTGKNVPIEIQELPVEESAGETEGEDTPVTDGE